MSILLDTYTIILIIWLYLSECVFDEQHLVLDDDVFQVDSVGVLHEHGHSALVVDALHVDLRCPLVRSRVHQIHSAFLLDLFIHLEQAY